MAGLSFHLVTHQVVDDSLLGHELAPPPRRLLAFGGDVALIAVPTVIAAIL